MNAKLIEKKDATIKEYDEDNREDEDIFDDFLDSVYGKFLGIYSPGDTLKEIDPMGYSESFSDWADELPTRYECPECGVVYENDEDKAVDCCQPDTWECAECGKEFDDEDEADACCVPEESDEEEPDAGE